MAKVERLEINSDGARAILNSPEVQAALLQKAEAIAKRAKGFGGNYVADVQPGKNRAHALVKTADGKAAYSNAKHNSLLKSVDAGRS